MNKWHNWEELVQEVHNQEKYQTPPEELEQYKDHNENDDFIKLFKNASKQYNIIKKNHFNKKPKKLESNKIYDQLKADYFKRKEANNKKYPKTDPKDIQFITNEMIITCKNCNELTYMFSEELSSKCGCGQIIKRKTTY